MRRNLRSLVLFISLLSAMMKPIASYGLADGPVVHAVLFYSPTCTHCQTVMSEDLAPLKAVYGEQLFILAISSGSKEGHELYSAAVERYEIPKNRQGVPMLIAGDVVLVGATEIPEQFPALIKRGLAAGGMDWPDIAGLHQYLTAHGLLTQTAKPPGAEPISTEQSNFASGDLHPAQNPGGLTPLQRFAQDWVGNSIAVIILLVLAVSLLGVMAQITRANSRPKPWPRWSIPVLVVIGLLVAAYMSYIELTLTDAVCGPVGDCNTVQQSSYATLFGVLPIAVLGIAGYLAIGAAWLTASYGPKKWQPGSTYTLWVMAIAGTLFSLYLTFLEPFVIGASCAWCLTSAVIMALLLWAATSSLIQRRRDRGVRPAR